MVEISDSELVAQLQSGSLNALGVLYDRHQQAVYRTALAITGDPDAAADLLQDTFLRLYRFADRVDTQRPLEPWLYRVTANLAYTWMKRSRRWLRPLEDVADLLMGGGRRGSRHQRAEVDDGWWPVQQALAGLPIAHRMVVALYYVNDLPVQEIAEILDIPVGTVKSRLHYGRQALKSVLDEQQTELLPGMQYEFT